MKSLITTLLLAITLSSTAFGDALEKDNLPRINSYFVKCELDLDKSDDNRWIIFNVKSEFFGLRTKLTLFDFWEGSFSNVSKTVFTKYGTAPFKSILNKDFDTMQFRNSSGDEEFAFFNETKRAVHRTLGSRNNYNNCFWFNEI